VSSLTVTTKEQLKKAKESNVNEIIIVGELAENLKKAKTITTLGAGVITVLTVALAITPASGGLSLAAVAPIAFTTGLSASVIIAIIAVGGVTLTIALFKDYDEAEAGVNINGAFIKLKRKSSS